MDKTQSLLNELEKTSEKYWNIPRETADFIKILAEIKCAKNILEIGTSNGYSGIFLAMAIKSNKGKLTTIEADFGRYSLAKDNFAKVDMKNIKIILGEANEITKNLKGKFDFVFIDANKSQYLEYLKNIEKNLSKKAVIVADNVISHKERLADYLNYINTSKQYSPVILPVGKGISVSVFEK